MMDNLLEALNKHLAHNGVLAGILAFLGSSLAGLAAELRSERTLSKRTVAAAVLNSGLFGTIVFLLGYAQLHQQLSYLIGSSLLAGIGGATVADFLVQLIRRGLSIRIRIDDEKKETP